jgi:hypothetical protein
VELDRPHGQRPNRAVPLTGFVVTARRHGPEDPDWVEDPNGIDGRDRDAGFAGGFEGLLFGLLLFVAGTLLVAYAWAVVDTKAAMEDAARQGARTFVEAPSPGAAVEAAEQSAADAVVGYGRVPSRADVSFAAGSFGRCQRVTISVSYPAPLLVLPFVGRIGTGQRVRAEHSELVDPYRTGLPGTAACQ